MVARTDINDHIRTDYYIVNFLFDPSGSLFRLLFSCSVVSNSLWPHGLQHTRLPCPSSSPRVCSNSCPLSRQCHPTISSSVVPFSFCLQSFPASESFPMNQLFTSGGQSIGASASASVFPINIQGWCPLGLIGLISLQSKGLSRVFSKNSKACILQFSAFFTVQLSHPYMTAGKTIALTRWTFVGKVMSLFFNMLSRFVIAFLPRNKCLNFMAAVTVCSDFGIQENKKSVIIFTFPPAVCHKVIGTRYMILVFWMLSFKSAFSCSSFTSSPL